MICVGSETGMNEVTIRKTTKGYVVWAPNNQVNFCRDFDELTAKLAEVFQADAYDLPIDDIEEVKKE